MISDIQPIAHLLAIAINRQRESTACIQNNQWDQFLWKLERTVVVGTVGNECWKAIRVVVGPNKMICCCLGRGVWAAWSIWLGFLRGIFIRSQRTIYLITRHVKKNEAVSIIARKLLPIIAGRFEQLKCSVNVRTHKVLGIHNGAINVRLSSEMDNCTWLMTVQELTQELGIIYVSTHKAVS